MGKFSDAELFGMTIRESATDGSDFTNPSADYRRLFLGEDGVLHVKDSAGAVTDPFTAGSGIPATIVDAKGDLIAATAADTVARLAALANGAALITASGETTGLKWRLNNDAAAAAPTVNEDSGDGYSIGSRWLDTTNDKEYVATDVTAGAAVWVETTATGGSLGAWTDYTPTWTATTTNPTLGSTTITGRYKSLDATTLAVNINIAITTGGAWNAGSGGYIFSLPAGETAVARVQVGSAHVLDSGTTNYAGICKVSASATTIGETVIADATGSRTLTHAVPITFATGDQINLAILLEVA